eukprot:352542-Chlamydomonas_euryale.AAC.9
MTTWRRHLPPRLRPRRRPGECVRSDMKGMPLAQDPGDGLKAIHLLGGVGWGGTHGNAAAAGNAAGH